MMSLGNLNQQYQQQQLQQQIQHPLLAAISGNNYANFQEQRRNHAMNQFRHLMAAASNNNGAYAGSAHSGYGRPEPPSSVGGGGNYDYHPQAPVPPHPPHPPHPPSDGGSYSYHATADTGYGAPVPPSAAKKKKDNNAATMTALTLLSFFFFVNLLQGCLREQMTAMNPTVMVLTGGVARNRFHKLAEMNSREQSSTPPSAATFTSGANIVVKPADLVSVAASSASAAIAIAPTVTLHSPYDSNKPASYSNNHNNFNQQAAISANSQHSVRPDLYDSMHAYPNHTLVSDTLPHNLHNPADGEYHQHQQHQHLHELQHQHQHQHQYEQQQHQHYPATQPEPATDYHSHYPRYSHREPWSHGAASSSSLAYKRGSYASPSSHSSSPSSYWSSKPVSTHSGGSNYYDDDVDRYGDSFYTRVN